MKRKMKTVFSLLLAVFLCLGMTNIGAYATEVDDTQSTELTSAGGTLDSGDYILNSDVTLDTDITVASGSDVTIDLNGYTLTGSGDSSVVTVEGTFTLTDSSSGGNGVLTTEGHGTLVSSSNYYGGGIYVDGGIFTLAGGTISGIGGTDTATGVTRGGGVYVGSGTFNMTGGAIKDNKAQRSSSGMGGGIYLSSSTFNMSGGTISGNTANGKGGGVYLNNTTLNMTGGSISSNDIVGTSTSNGYGGGVYLSSNKSTKVYMSGGTISGNNTYNLGGGVYVDGTSPTFSLSGTAVIDGNTKDDNTADNVYLKSSSVITLAGALTSGASVGVTTSSLPTEDSAVQVTSTETDTSYYDDSKVYFSSDVDGYYIVRNSESGYLELSVENEPENEKISEPSITKTADKTSVAAGGTVNYTLTSTVPETMVNSISYNLVGDSYVGTAGEYVLTFHDSLDDGLNLDSESIVVTVNGVKLDAKYYTVDASAITVAIDLASLYNDGVITEDDLGIASIVVTYSATLSSDASAGTYANTAYVTWSGSDDPSVEDTVKVTTYQIKVFKYDSSDNTGLTGASFKLTDAEGNVVATLTSGDDGYVTSAGLAEGTYYLTETAAPDGYVKSDSAVEVTVNAESATDYIVTVNFANASIPGTGGMGTTLYTVLGLCILLAASIVFMVSRKRRA